MSYLQQSIEERIEERKRLLAARETAKQAKKYSESSRGKLEQQDKDIIDFTTRMLQAIKTNILINNGFKSWVLVNMPSASRAHHEAEYYQKVSKKAFKQVLLDLSILDFQFVAISSYSLQALASSRQLELIQQALEKYSQSRIEFVQEIAQPLPGTIDGSASSTSTAAICPGTTAGEWLIPMDESDHRDDTVSRTSTSPSCRTFS
ncbi:MAG: hypothetical protein KBD64_04745 [Gammaproteobacteria bacterium]|nr:hypothetical protein [Gammaproteobacteria bacterium]